MRTHVDVTMVRRRRVVRACAVVSSLALLAAPERAATAAGAGAAPWQAESALPADVNPESRNRLALPAPNPAGGASAAADAIRGAGSGADVRWDAAAGRPLLELAILITAREHDAPFEWTLHELEALAVGLDPAVIDVVRNREPLDTLGDREATIVRAGREIFGAHRLSPETYRRAVALFGEAGFVDIVTLMGRYAGTAARLAAFNQQMPPGWPQLLPLPFTPPDDIDPRSRSRLEPLPPPAQITRATPSLYGRTLSPYGTGPGQIRGHGAGRASLEANVPQPLLDLATLVTARAYDVQYAWTLTEPVALENGLAPAAVNAVRVRIPDQIDHRFRRKSISESDPIRSLIPMEIDHRFRSKSITCHRS
ncbi:MAG: hypothetical protein OXF93_10675 [Acidobacteria bacterium]|nr:hypothetical protein [Acidobacteriota bacterium]